MTDWITMDWQNLAPIAISVLIIVAALIAFTRIFGLRSFSKLSGFDFAITVAFGSILAGTVIAEDPPVMQGIAAMLLLFGLQAIIAFGRRRWDWVSAMVDNRPRLVWHEGEFLTDNMRKAQITRSDIIAKMREANAIRLSDVIAVVVEPTGDIAVLHDTGDDRTIDNAVMDDVIGWPRQN